MSKLLSNIPKHRRVLVEVIEDGSAKTFVYRDLDEESQDSSMNLFWRLVQRRKRRKRSTLPR